jgi:hypothetical protein
MPIRYGGNCATSSLSFPRESVRRSATSPLQIDTVQRKVLFAKSIPSVETRFMGLPLLKDRCRNSILTPRCLLGTGKFLTFVRCR